MNGNQLLIHLLKEMNQAQGSGHIYYTVQGGRDGKIIVDLRRIHSLTYHGVPIDVSTLEMLKVRRAVALPSLTPLSTAPHPPHTPDMAAVLAALDKTATRLTSSIDSR